MPRRGWDRAAVVLAAAELVDAEGAGTLTLARLAERLDIRMPSLYNHIAGLADLRLALAALAARELTEALRSAAIGRAGADALGALAQAYRAYAKAHPGRYAYLARVPADADAAVLAAMSAPVAVVLEVLAAGGITGADAIHTVRAFRAATHGFAALEMGGGFQLAEDVDESFRRMLAALIAGLSFSQAARASQPAM